MQAFSDFALKIVMSPNPIRSLDNSLTAAQTRGHDYFMGCAGLDSLTGQPAVCLDGAALRLLARIPGAEITYTCLPPGWPR